MMCIVSFEMGLIWEVVELVSCWSILYQWLSGLEANKFQGVEEKGAEVRVKIDETSGERIIQIKITK